MLLCQVQISKEKENEVRTHNLNQVVSANLSNIWRQKMMVASKF